MNQSREQKKKKGDRKKTKEDGYTDKA